MDTVTVYLKTLKKRELGTIKAEEQGSSEAIFDRYVKHYVDYVQARLAEDGFSLHVDRGANEHSYLVNADNAEAESRAHALMSGGIIGGFWDWYS